MKMVYRYPYICLNSLAPESTVYVRPPLLEGLPTPLGVITLWNPIPDFSGVSIHHLEIVMIFLNQGPPTGVLAIPSINIAFIFDTCHMYMSQEHVHVLLYMSPKWRTMSINRQKSKVRKTIYCRLLPCSD